MTRDQSAGPVRVLVVEDNEEVTRFLQELLTADGYEVVQARNGVEAMVALTAPPEECPQVVLLDIGLPLESGVSVLSFLRNVLRSGLPVIVLTGSADEQEEQTIREMGVTAYLRKPTSSEHLLAAITEAVR